MNYFSKKVEKHIKHILTTLILVTLGLTVSRTAIAQTDDATKIIPSILFLLQDSCSERFSIEDFNFSCGDAPTSRFYQLVTENRCLAIEETPSFRGLAILSQDNGDSVFSISVTTYLQSTTINLNCNSDNSQVENQNVVLGFSNGPTIPGNQNWSTSFTLIRSTASVSVMDIYLSPN